MAAAAPTARPIQCQQRKSSRHSAGQSDQPIWMCCLAISQLLFLIALSATSIPSCFTDCRDCFVQICRTADNKWRPSGTTAATEAKGGGGEGGRWGAFGGPPNGRCE